MLKEMIMDYIKVSTEDNVINHEQFQIGQMMTYQDVNQAPSKSIVEHYPCASHFCDPESIIYLFVDFVIQLCCID